MRALEREEDLGMALVNSFDPKQRKQAIFSEIAPYDLITLATMRAKLDGDPQGLPASKMNDRQFEALLELIAEYAGNMPPDVAAERMKAVRETPRNRFFFPVGRRDFTEAATGCHCGKCHHGKSRGKGQLLQNPGTVVPGGVRQHAEPADPADIARLSPGDAQRDACMNVAFNGPDGPVNAFSKERSGTNLNGLGYQNQTFVDEVLEAAPQTRSLVS
jgi:hypothetical protein